LQIDIFAAGHRRADAGDALEEPDALLEEEIFVEQGPYRAEIGDISAELVIERFAGENFDLFFVSRPST